MTKDNFADKLRQLRTARGLSQQQLAMKMYVDRSSIARWESGLRLPDMVQVTRLAECLGVEVSDLLPEGGATARIPQVILVDDEKPILQGELRLLERTMDGAEIRGFTKPSEALAFARIVTVDLAFLDIELGKTSGIDLCHQLMEINPVINVVYVTAWPNHALEAWDTEASGFLVKPLVQKDILAVLKKLRHPIPKFSGGVRNGKRGRPEKPE